MVISIQHAKYLENYKLTIQFSDGSEQIIDFEKFLSNALNPMITKYLNQKEFKKFNIEHGDLEWNNYEMCFPIWDLYNGSIQ